MRNFFAANLLMLLLCGSPNLWAAGANPKVLLQTNLGEFVIELFPREAPATVKNFLENVDDNLYSGTIFHSVVPGFFIQGGGLTSDFSIKPSHTIIKNEASNGLKNETFMVSMIRNGSGDSATSQFFINMQDNPALDTNGRNTGYAVFGKVIEGTDIVEKISLQPRGMYEKFPEAPNFAVRILKILRIESNSNLNVARAQPSQEISDTNLTSSPQTSSTQ